MAVQNCRGGLIAFKIDGKVYQAKGDFSYNLGHPKRESIIGSDGVHGYKEIPQPAFLEGEITDDKESVDLNQLTRLDGVTLTLNLAVGKSIVFRNAYFAGEGTAHTGEGNISIRFEARSAEEVTL